MSINFVHKLLGSAVLPQRCLNLRDFLMELELKDLGQTLAIGGFTVFGLVYLLSLLKPSWSAVFTSLSFDSNKFYQSAMLAALVFAAGILVEGVSKNSSAERWSGADLFNYILDTDKELRLRSLFTVHEYAQDHVDFTPNPIYEDLTSIHSNDQSFTKHLDVIKSYTAPCPGKEPKDCIRVSGLDHVKNLQKAVNGIYYAAKNRDYQEGNYFNELRGIENRFDFARSLAFLCLIFTTCYLLLGLLCSTLPKRRLLVEARSKRKVIFVIFLAYLLGVFLARTSFRSETINYNLRVFGYYASIISNRADTGSKIAADAATPQTPATTGTSAMPQLSHPPTSNAP